MVDTIIKVGDWIQEKVKTKAGIFVLGIFLGVVPSSTVSYLLYQDGKYKDEKIVQEVLRMKDLEDEKDKWQEKAFNAERNCLEKVREMAIFLQDLEYDYVHKEDDSRRTIEKHEEQLDQYEDISSKLQTLKRELKDED